jgi:hypothetical protein
MTIMLLVLKSVLADHALPSFILSGSSVVAVHERTDVGLYLSTGN